MIFINRIIRSAMLDSRVYEEVESDYTATLPAMLVVLLSSISGALAPGSGLEDSSAPMAIILAAFFGIVSWAVWAGVTYVIGAKLLPEPTTEANWGQLARTTGFAQAPGLLAIIGVLSGVVSLVIGIWGIVAMVIAVRQALDYTSTMRAVAVVVLAFIPSVVISLFVIVPVAGILGLGSN